MGPYLETSCVSTPSFTHVVPYCGTWGHTGDITLPEPITRMTPITRISRFQEESILAALGHYHTTSWVSTPWFNCVVPDSTTRGHTGDITLPGPITRMSPITRISPFHEESMLPALEQYHTTSWGCTPWFTCLVPDCATRVHTGYISLPDY